MRKKVELFLAVLIFIKLEVEGYYQKHNTEAIAASEEIQALLEKLTHLIAARIENEYHKIPENYSLTGKLKNKTYKTSIGISVDPNGTATPGKSMVYIFDPTKPEAAFFNITTLFNYPLIELGDPVTLDNEASEKSSRNKRNPEPKFVGGRGGGGGGGRGGGGRGSSAARSASKSSSSRNSFGSGGGVFASGVGGARPHLWLFVGGSSSSRSSNYRYISDNEYDAENDTDSTDQACEKRKCSFEERKNRA
uniref:Uncharacterized protein n=1 Tax=Acrobeloides nanus TaxID=290746 RepID=A0A914DPT6_9BILA